MTDVAEIAARLKLRRAGRDYVGACPSCGYGGAFTVTIRGDQTLFRCHACQDQTRVVQALVERGLWRRSGTPRRSNGDGHVVATRSHAGTLRAVRDLISDSRPATGTVVERYLRSRGLKAPIPPTIRYLPDAWHAESGRSWPCMLALVTRWPERQPCAVHRTFLTPRGAKLAVLPAKKTLGSTRGGAVRLAAAGSVLGIGEGLETALSIQESCDIPVWAALSAGNLKVVRLPDLPLASTIIVGADNDPAGRRAAEDAALAWSVLGRNVRIAVPPVAGEDFNDVIRTCE